MGCFSFSFTINVLCTGLGNPCGPVPMPRLRARKPSDPEPKACDWARGVAHPVRSWMRRWLADFCMAYAIRLLAGNNGKQLLENWNIRWLLTLTVHYCWRQRAACVFLPRRYTYLRTADYSLRNVPYVQYTESYGGIEGLPVCYNVLCCSLMLMGGLAIRCGLAKGWKALTLGCFQHVPPRIKGGHALSRNLSYVQCVMEEHRGVLFRKRITWMMFFIFFLIFLFWFWRWLSVRKKRLKSLSSILNVPDRADLLGFENLLFGLTLKLSQNSQFCCGHQFVINYPAHAEQCLSNVMSQYVWQLQEMLSLDTILQYYYSCPVKTTVEKNNPSPITPIHKRKSLNYTDWEK